MTVQSVKERELPELDDDFAQTASEFDTLDELRADVRDRVTQMKTVQSGGLRTISFSSLTCISSFTRDAGRQKRRGLTWDDVDL